MEKRKKEKKEAAICWQDLCIPVRRSIHVRTVMYLTLFSIARRRRESVRLPYLKNENATGNEVVVGHVKIT